MKLKTAHETSTVLVAIWGYTAVLLTGQFLQPVLIGAYIAAGFAWYCRVRNIAVPRIILNIASCLAFAAALVWSSRNLLDATMYLFLVLQAIQLFSLRRIEECRWNYTCALFHIIGSAVLTTSLAFGIVFLVFLVLCIYSLLLYALRREWRVVDRINNAQRKPTGIRSDNTDSYSSAPTWDTAAPLPHGLGLCTVGLIFLVLAGSAITFASVPRLATQNLFRGYGQPAEQPDVSAFDETIEFGSFEKIQLDDTIALFAQPLGKERPDYLRLRGSALDSFDGKTWRRTTVPGSVVGGVKFRAFSVRLQDSELKLRIVQPPGITNYLFGETFPMQMQAPPGIFIYLDSLSGSAWLANSQAKELQYFSESRIEELTSRKDPGTLPLSGRPASYLYGADEIEPPSWRLPFADALTTGLIEEMSRSAGETTTTEEGRRRRWFNRSPREAKQQQLMQYLEKCTSLPQALLTPAIRQLAQDWTSGAKTPFEKAMAIERKLRTEYSYSLEQRPRGNFIEDFLFRVKEGHCEYFATSMAVLLRAGGIPSRVVNGFYSVEWNGIAQSFSVRQRDAHSWVEVWLGPNYGWMTFDPTPPAGVGRSSRTSWLTTAWQRLVEATQLRWYRYVVDYGPSDQMGIVKSALTMRDRLRDSFAKLKHLVDWVPENVDNTQEHGTNRFLIPVLVAAGLTGAGFFLMRFLQWVRRRYRRRSKAARIRFYQDLLKALARLGYEIKPGQTPREFAANVSASLELPAFAQVTELYYAVRFSDQPMSEEQFVAIDQLRSSIAKRKAQ